MVGGYEHFGWGRDRHMAASLYDLLALNTQASGQWRKKPPEIEAWPRPELPEKAVKTAKAVSVKDIFNQFTSTL